MTSCRILLQRVLYILATLAIFYGGIAKTDPDTGESADSLINMINGSFPFDSSIIFTLIFLLLVDYFLIQNVLSLLGKDFNSLKDFKDTDCRILVCTILLSLSFAF